MKLLVFEGQTWKKFESIKTINRPLYKKVCKMLNNMLKGDLTSGLNKTEPLRYNLKGLWSKELSPSERLIYKFDDEYLYIFAIGGGDI